MKSSTFLLTLALAAAALLAVGCTQKCGPANCTGCCDSSGLCEVGTTFNACGRAGDSCGACTVTQECQLGQCQSINQNHCDPHTCTGCCNASQCVTSCPNGMFCSAGTCQTQTTDGGTCGPSNCTGCCQGNTCVPVNQQTSACGSGGATCQACTGATQSCQGGACVSGCGPGNCTGCCAGSTCVPLANETTLQCGTTAAAGTACTACGGGQSCTGTCTGGGLCDSSTCPTGCCMGSTCVAPPTNTECGFDGGACHNCGANATCSAVGVCVANTCTGCIDSVGACQTGTANNDCGKNGGACQICLGTTTCAQGSCVGGPSDGGCTHYTTFPVMDSIGDYNTDAGGYLISEAREFTSTGTLLWNQVYYSSTGGVTLPLTGTFSTANSWATCQPCVTMATGGCTNVGCTTGKFFLTTGGTSTVTQASQVLTGGSYVATGSALHFVEWNNPAISDTPVTGGQCIDLDSMSVNVSW